ncbi:MAG TPA: phosphoribosyltransferase [Thermodesulfovibrionales bacterium]|nr:phosphoribosyltransferase [Thermodesulfovibrionales bacterium]
MLYRDRRDAGERLAARLTGYKDRADVLVLALPRGGVVTGHEVAHALNCPLDVLIVRKIGFPGQPELAIGALSETGAVSLNKRIIESYGIDEEYIRSEISRERKEVERRAALYRGDRGIPLLSGKVIILVDDGVATGATIKAAISTLKEENLSRLVAALPVASRKAEREIGQMVDEMVCLSAPDDFMAVGNYYRDFRQVSDDEVIDILRGQGVTLDSKETGERA